MKIVHINTEVRYSQAFNSILWTKEFEKKGMKLDLFVNENNSLDKNDVNLLSGSSNQKINKTINRILGKVQFKLGVQNRILYENRSIFNNAKFIEADIVHLHLVNPNSISLRRIHEISLNKPLVWSWHDPWPLTGHCVYPDKCTEWDNSCKSCPDLSRNFAVNRDRTFKNRSEKYSLMSEIDMQVHVSSKWMYDLIKRSGIKLKKDPRIIPLPSLYSQSDRVNKRLSFREKHKIRDEQIVIGFRDTKQFQKNLRLVENIFIKLNPSDNLVLVSVDDVGILKQFEEKFRIIELGNLHQIEKLEEFYTGIDLFLNLSTSEAYGMMAAEATSLKTPCLTLRGTATSEIIQKYGGMEIQNLSEGVDFLESLILNPFHAFENLSSLINPSKISGLSVSDFAENMKSVYSQILER